MGTHPANPAAATDGTDAADPIGDFPAPMYSGACGWG